MNKNEEVRKKGERNSNTAGNNFGPRSMYQIISPFASKVKLLR
jgi:hypothetical protein